MKITGEATFGSLRTAIDEAREEGGGTVALEELIEIEVEIDECEAHDKLVHLCEAPDDWDEPEPEPIEETDITDAIEALASGDRAMARILFGRAFQSYPRLSATIERALMSKDEPGQHTLALVA